MRIILALFVVAVAAFALAEADRPKSDCEKHRDSVDGHETIMKLVLKCKENGDYEELQCYKDSKFCVCYDKKGHAASPISSKIKKCACHLKRKEKIDRGHDNAFIPQCDEDGSFAKKQCWDHNDSCWCVDEQGNQKGDIKADGSKLNCE